MQDSKRLPFFLLGKPSLIPSLYNSASYIYKCLYRLAILRKSLEIPRIVRANSTCSHIYKQPRNGFSTRKDLKGRQFILLLTLPPSPRLCTLLSTSATPCLESIHNLAHQRAGWCQHQPVWAWLHMEARQRAMEIPAVTLWASDDFSVPRFPQLSSVVIIHLLYVVETSTCGKSTWTQTCGKGSYTEHHLNSLCLAISPWQP